MKGIDVTIALDEVVTGHRQYDEDGEPYGPPVTVLDLIIEGASRLLFEKVVRDAEGGYPGLSERVTRIRDEAIRAAIEPKITEALDRAVQPTDPYGNPKGQARTLAEVIVDKATEQLKTHERRSSSFGPPKTVLEGLLENEVRREVGKSLREAVKDAEAQVRAAVQEQAAEVIAETIQRVAR